MDFINEMDESLPDTWIGFSDCHQEGTFMWTDGSLSDYTQWISGEFNNENEKENCVHIDFQGSLGSWNDASCSTQLPFICAYRI
ncbi:lectin-like [Callorhinchus milii]|nr:lectin-like [Callorhinchus milii]XP_042191659.1 lectin-like [Callorhinchus milii]